MYDDKWLILMVRFPHLGPFRISNRLLGFSKQIRNYSNLLGLFGELALVIRS